MGAIVATLLAACFGAFILMDVTNMDAAWLFLPSGVLQAAMLVLHDVAFAEKPLARTAALADPAASLQGSVQVPSVDANTNIPNSKVHEQDIPSNSAGV